MGNKAFDRINTVGQKLQDWNVRERSKEHSTDSTRDRQIGFVGVLSIIFNLVRRTPPIEWDEIGMGKLTREFLPGGS